MGKQSPSVPDVKECGCYYESDVDRLFEALKEYVKSEITDATADLEDSCAGSSSYETGLILHKALKRVFSRGKRC